MRVERRIDARYQAALKSNTEPAHDAEAALWRLHVQQMPDHIIERVIDLHEDVFEREVLQAWIFAGASDARLNRDLALSLPVIQAYRYLCCDIGQFRDRLELLRWVRSYKGTVEGKLLLEKAVAYRGLEAVAHICGFESTLDPQHVAEHTMREGFFRGVSTMRSSRITSAEANAAHQLLKTAMIAAVTAQKRGSANIAETLLNLQHRDMTSTIDALTAADTNEPIGEILH